ncbi:hypothetical protein PIB30_053584 [Stylosanthes scabra]|uniref:Uncharacterized protein n=1 Tax=Stylosanthes scabra TaxID=79078 RepID=A0ABU6VKI8_9FABA|nr:hypothetical protein [Stylosanthes scabra]
MDARASGDCPDHATTGLLGPNAGDRKRTVSICHGGSARSRCRMWPIISDCAQTVTRSTGTCGNSGCGMGQTPGRWPRNIWADIPRLEGEELCWVRMTWLRQRVQMTPGNGAPPDVLR